MRGTENITVRCDLGVLRCCGAFHVTCVHRTRSWVVYFEQTRCSAQVVDGAGRANFLDSSACCLRA